MGNERVFVTSTKIRSTIPTTKIVPLIINTMFFFMMCLLLCVFFVYTLIMEKEHVTLKDTKRPNRVFIEWDTTVSSCNVGVAVGSAVSENAP